MGAKVILIERGKMGGDCLNYGCIPSKSLIAAAKVANTARTGAKFGITASNVKVDFGKVHKHVHDVIASIAPHDSESRFRKLGVRVIKASAKFISRKQVVAGNYRITAKYFAVCSGSSPSVPPIAGLKDVPYYTNETIFSLKQAPKKLLVLGMGPIGCELSQAFARLGSNVTMISNSTFMPREDSDLAKYVKNAFIKDKINITQSAQIDKITKTKDGITIQYSKDNKLQKISGTHLLIATGRIANTADLDLTTAGVNCENGFIKTDKYLRTSNKRIFALGDVHGGGQFTHMAGYDAGIAIRNILFKMRAKITGAGGHPLLPRVTYTDPEIASAGLSEQQAVEKFGDNIRIITSDFADNDRARSEQATDGMIKIITTKKGKILGASICGKNVGDLLLPWIMAISDGKKIGSMASYIVPYPTFGEISKRVAGSYFTESLFSERTKSIVRFLMRIFG